MNNALLFIGGFFVIVLAALFAVPHFVDWNSYRGVFEEEASRVLGRDVRIGGAVNVRLLPAPYVSLEKLKIADPSSSTGESLFRAESFTLWLSVPPLLQGVVEANKVEVRRPVVQLVATPEGGGNWQSLSVNPGQMPLIPKGVSLQSVTITDGALVIGAAGRSEITRYEAINGELTAESLYGPYKFSGSVSADGSKREVRFATSAIEGDQDLRFKATMHALATGNTYTVSGKVNNLDGHVKVDGDLTAGLNVTLLDPAQALSGSAPKSEATAKISGDATGFELKDIAITLQHSATPQLLTGSAKVSWPQRTKIDLELASRWLDFDKMTPSGKAVPLDVARSLFDTLASNLPEEADTSTKVILDQVTLGGDSVSDVRFQAIRAGGPLELKGVRANLPGGARVEFDGELSGAEAARKFAGTIALSGQSLQRFITWGTAKAGFINARADGPFALEGALALSRAGISVRDATAEIAGMPISGEFTANFEGRRKISLILEGNRLDAGAIWPGCLSPEFISGILQSPYDEKAVSEAPAQQPSEVTGLSNASTFTPADMDVRVRLRASEVIDGERILKNVDADFSVENGSLSMPKLFLTTADGLTVELEGETKVQASPSTGKGVETVAAARRRGQVRGVVSAPDGAAVLGLSRALNIDTNAHGSPQAWSALAPLRVAGSVTFGARLPQSTDVRFDGTLANARVTGAMLIDRGWRDWRVSPGDITLTAESDQIVQTLSAVLGVTQKTTAEGADAARAGTLALKAAAGESGQFLSNVMLRSGNFDLQYDGRAKFASGDGWQSSGDVRIKADDGRSALRLAGLNMGNGSGMVPLEGALKIDTGKSGQTLVMENLRAGGSKVSGRVHLASTESAQVKEPALAIDAELDVDTAQVPAMLSLLTSETVAAAPAVITADNDDKALPAGRKKRAPLSAALAPIIPAAAAEPLIWPSETFEPGLFANVTGRVKAKFGTLAIEPGLSLSNAAFEAAFTPNRIDVTRIEGAALGGLVTSTVTLEKDPVGVKATSSFLLKAGGDDNLAATLKFEASGRASSPAGLIADLKGKGELALAEGALRVNSPAALTGVADAAIRGKGPAAGEELTAAVRAALKDSAQPLGGFSVPLSVGDGVVRFDKVKLESGEGRSQFSASIQLDTLRMISEWQIEPKVQRGPQSSERILLAPVSIIYNGKLKDLATLEPEVAVAALERELSVRRMERDVEELERMRKDDQARAAAEQERRSALEAERVKAAAAAKAAKDAAAAAGLPPPASPPAGAPGGAAPQLNGGQAAPQTLNGSSDAAAEPASVTAQGDPTAGTNKAAGETAAPAEPASSWKPAVRKKRLQDTPNWKPFQVTPY